MISGKRLGIILSFLCVIGLFRLVLMYLRAQELQRLIEQIRAEEFLRGGNSILNELGKPDIHPDILLGAIIVVGFSIVAFPLIGFWYDKRTKDKFEMPKQALPSSSASMNPTRIIISFIVALLPVIVIHNCVFYYCTCRRVPMCIFPHQNTSSIIT